MQLPPPPCPFFVFVFVPLAAAIIVPFLLPLLNVVIKKRNSILSLVYCSFVLWPPLGSPSASDRLWFTDIDFSFFFGIVTTTPLLLNTVSWSLLLIFLSSLVLWPQPLLFHWIPSLVHCYWFFPSSLVLWPPPLCYWIPSLVRYYWFFCLLWYCDHNPFVIEYRLWFITIDFYVFFWYGDHNPFVIEYRLWFITIDFSVFFGTVTATPLLVNTVSCSLLLIFLSSLVLWPQPLCYWIPSLVHYYWFFFFSLYCDYNPFVIEYRLWFITIDFSFFFGIVTTTPLLLNIVCCSLLLIFLSSLVLWPFVDTPFVVKYRLWLIDIEGVFFVFWPSLGTPFLFLFYIFIEYVSCLLLLIFHSSLVLWPPLSTPFVVKYHLWLIDIEEFFFV